MMQTIPDELLKEISEFLPPAERDEMAIPSYRHRNPIMRKIAWSRVGVLAGWIEDWGRNHRIPVETRALMDYGCGCGVLFETAARNAGTVYGVDIVLTAAQFVIGRLGIDGVELVDPNRARERIAPGSLDLIVCGEVLEHLASLNEVSAFFRTSLRPEGRLLVSLPTENLVYRIGRRIAGFQAGHHHFDARTIHGKLLDTGFDTVRMRKLPFSAGMTVYWCVEYVAA